MADWFRPGSLPWIMVDNTVLHLPRRSAWSVASNTGWDASIGTPELKLAADRGRIQIPVYKSDGRDIVETHSLQGYGIGVSAGVNLQIPFFSLSWSTADDPGRGTPIYESPFCREPVEARYLEGMCAVLSGNAVLPSDGLAGRQVSGAMLVFGDRFSGGSLLPTSINAVAFILSAGATAINFGGAGVEVMFYNLTIKS